MYKQTIYVLGNPIYEPDSLPVRLLPKLRENFPEFEFKHFDPTEELPEVPHLVLIDTVINTPRILVLTDKDLDKIHTYAATSTSLHDFDLAFSLKLAKKLNKIKTFEILGLPPGMKEDEAIKQLKPLIIKE